MTTSTTPVLVGIGQHSERLGEAGYEALSPADLAARAGAAALADAGVAAEVVEVLACTRQFDESFPGMQAALGRPDSFPGAVARRLGVGPARLLYAVTGGQSPQQLVTSLAAEIASGTTGAALVVGSEAISTVLSLSRRSDPPDFTETTGLDAGDAGVGLEGIVTRSQVVHGLTDAPTQYALFENARRGRLGQSRAEQAAEMGRWFAPFTEVAAANPHAAVREARSGAELVHVDDDNRVIVDPYPKRVVAREKVNQSAAVLVTSEAVAEAAGVPREQWVYLRGHSDLRDRELLHRPELDRSPSSVRAVEAALAQAGIDLDDLDAIDLYSCFPVAVSIVAEELGLAPDDPRRLTVTGGLPFFGGPGNGYSLHAIAEVVAACRRTPGSWGLVGANGGMLSKYSTGVYSTTPGPWVPGEDRRLQAELDAAPDVPVAEHPSGAATVETWTVKYDGPTPRAVVVGRLEDGRRFVANDVPGDDQVRGLLLGEDGPGARVHVRATPDGNRVALSAARLDELVPERAAGLREDYATLRVRREGHLLEITMVGADDRNELTSAASHELAEVVAAFEADRELWAAVLTGSGGLAFCTDTDMAQPTITPALLVPAGGLGGLTERRLTKPVIAALNGDALDAALELALACTLVVAEEHVRLGLGQARIGLLPAAGGLARLPRAVPTAVAREMVLTGRRLTAAEAERWGLVNRVAPRGSGLAVARELAGEVIASSPTSVRLALGAMADGAAEPDVRDAVAVTQEALDRLMVANDTSEGVNAAWGGRPPRWRNG